MQRHECNKQLFIYLNNFLEFYLNNYSNSLPKSGCYTMAPTTQQALGVTVDSFMLTALGIGMASSILDGIQLHSAVLA
jgi:hypothetical protein